MLPNASKTTNRHTPAVLLVIGLAVIALSTMGCPEPRDGNPQIAVSPRAIDRANLIPSHRKKTPDPNARARVHPMKAGEALDGPNATGKPGDWLLENDEVVFVIDGLGGGSGFEQSGGNLIDAADAKTRKDELGQFFTYFGMFPRQGVYTKIESRASNDGSASIIVRGAELYDQMIAVETDYVLARADRAMLITTKLTNNGPAPVTLGLGDAIQWGGTEKIAPGQPINFSGRSSGPYLGGVGRWVSYGVTTPDGEIAAVNGGTWTDTEQVKSVTIAPGASTEYARVFAVGRKGDSASVVAELTSAADGELGTIEVSLVDRAGRPVSPGERARIGLAAAIDGPELLFIASSADGFAGDVPPGHWFAGYASSAGRRAVGPRVAVDVKKDGVVKLTAAVSDAGAVEVGCTGANGKRVPCKVTVEGLEGTPRPELGPAHLASTARNVLYAAEADAKAPLAPGKYRFTATRGPEFAADSREITITGDTHLSFVIARVVDTHDWLATDFHQHTILSGDSPVALPDRVRSNVCEGVELAVSSEHNVVFDLQPIVKQLGLEAFLVEIAGDEVTTDADRKPWGHANIFPLPVRNEPRGGAFPYIGVSPRDTFQAARAMPGKHIVQVNHPRSALNGYFDLTGFDPRTGVGTRAGYDPVFDSLEVWNGRSVTARTKVLEDFFAVLRTSHPVTAIGDTDTHGVVGQESGYPRTYVHMKDTDLEAWSGARTDELVDAIKGTREVILTNGPFLTVTVNGAGVGSLVKSRDLDIEIRVQSAPFAEVGTIGLQFVNGTKVAPASVTQKKNAAGALEAEVRFRVRVASDDAFVVIASGTKPMRPLLSGDDADIAPFAMSGAIWVDADGDGKSLGR